MSVCGFNAMSDVKARPIELQRQERISSLVVMAEKLLKQKSSEQDILKELMRVSQKDYLLSNNAARDYAKTALSIAQE